MPSITRTTSSDPDFVALVDLLNAEMAVRDGDEHAFYNQFNQLDSIPHALVIYEADTPIACGAIRPYNADTVEIKRMFTLPAWRGRGVAALVLGELETWAAELGYLRCILETGLYLSQAVRLYEKNGYRRIPNYGQYIGIENSVCFEKGLSPLRGA